MKRYTKDEITSIVNQCYKIATKNWQPSLGYEVLVKGGITLGIAHEEESRIKDLESALADSRNAKALLEEKLAIAAEALDLWSETSDTKRIEDAAREALAKIRGEGK